MTELPLFLGFLSSTLFADFETRSSLAFLLGSGLMQAQLVYLPRHIDILQTPSPLFGFDELQTRDVVSFSSLGVFVSSEQSHLKVRKEILRKLNSQKVKILELRRKLGKEVDTSGKAKKYAK